ncbi:MAG: type II toxin-antitoxin system VapC family toxin [Candidatus Dojkabacteria bacterium]
MERYIFDASFIVAFIAPDEEEDTTHYYFNKYFANQAEVYILQLTDFEVANVIRNLVLRKRLTKKQAMNLLKLYRSYEFQILEPDLSKAMMLSLKFNINIYDASYLAACTEEKIPLLTFDKKLDALTQTCLNSTNIYSID